MSESNEDLILQVEDQMERFIQLFRKRFIHLASLFQIGEGQLRVLYCLQREGKCTPTVLSQKMSITSGGATSIADRLVELGYIDRYRCDIDRRTVYISINEKGVTLLNQIRQTMRHQISEMLQSTTTTQLQQVIEAFEWVNLMMDKDHLDKKGARN